MEFIDLGLPSGTKWADCNLGAIKPEEYGDYFMWATNKLNTDDECNYTTTPYNKGSNKDDGWTKYNNDDGKTTLDPMDDIASIITAGKAHIPTEEDFKELFAHTKHEWTYQNYVLGRKFIANNGNSIFIPLNGFKVDNEVMGEKLTFSLWTSTRLESPSYAFGISISYVSNKMKLEGYHRSFAIGIRAVMN